MQSYSATADIDSVKLPRRGMYHCCKLLFHPQRTAAAADVARDPEKFLYRQQLHALVARDGGRLFEISADAPERIETKMVLVKDCPGFVEI